MTRLPAAMVACRPPLTMEYRHGAPRAPLQQVDVSMVPSMVLYIFYTLYSNFYTIYPKGDGRAPLQQVEVSMVPSGRHVYTPYPTLYTLYSEGDGRAPLQQEDVSMVPSGLDDG